MISLGNSSRENHGSSSREVDELDSKFLLEEYEKKYKDDAFAEVTIQVE